MEPTASAAEQERAALEATAEAEAAAWAQQRKRARRLRQGARLVGLFGSPSVAQVDSVLDPEGASSQPVAMPARAQSHRHMVVAAEDDRVPAADADASTDAIASIRMTPHTRETVELVLGVHWDATHEIVHSTVRDGRRKIDAAAGRRAKATEERLQQLELEVQSKLKLQAMTKVLQDLPVEDIIADMEAHVKEVTAVVRKDHQDWLLSHLDFVDEFAKFHSGRLHDLLTRVGDEHEARVSLREERIQHKKETRIDMVTQMVTDQVREELRRDMEMRIWTQKTAMEKQTVRLQQGLEEERSKRESAETTIEALIASAKAQAETAQLAFEQMEQQMQQMEGEIESARSSTISSDREALRLAIEARKREALEREALQKALDEKKLGDEEDSAEDDETRALIAKDRQLRAGLNPYVWQCIAKVQAIIRGIQARARLKRKQARKEHMRQLRGAVIAAARLTAVGRKGTEQRQKQEQEQQQEQEEQRLKQQQQLKSAQDQLAALEAELSAEKAACAGLEQKVAELEIARQQDAQEIQELLQASQVPTSSVSSQSGPGNVDMYNLGTNSNDQVSILQETLQKLRGERGADGIGSVDIDAILDRVFAWLWEESDLYVLKPDGFQGSTVGFLHGDAEDKILAAFERAGPLRPHPTIDDAMYRTNHGTVIPRGTGVEHVDLGEFASLLGLEPGSNSLVMLNQYSPRHAQQRTATPPRSLASADGRRPVPGGHRFAIGATRLKGENRTPVQPALAPVAPGERVVQLNMETVQASIAKRNSQMRLGSRGLVSGAASARGASRGKGDRGGVGARSPRSARVAKLAVGRPSLQAHSDGSGSLPAHFDELVQAGVIGSLTPKLVVNWDLDHLEQRRPDASAIPGRGESSNGLVAAQSSQASFYSYSDRGGLSAQSSTASLLLRSSGVPVPPSLPTSRGLLDAGPSLSDVIPGHELPPPMAIAHIEHKFAPNPDLSMRA